jgi:hypothetical protein
MNLSKMSKEELVKLLQQQQASQASGLMVKFNSGGGIFIRSSKFQEWSTAKNKSYVAGINIPPNTAQVLFNDPQLLELIREEVNALVKNK